MILDIKIPDIKIQPLFSSPVRQFDRNMPRGTHNDRTTVGMGLHLAPESLQKQKELLGKHGRDLPDETHFPDWSSRRD
ncbi:hypothetical protein [Bradyrhizobium sp. dw_78]|uniref:hypothetical protein n=1 Tax=Bradyrhizobium sp. dw_78 TaxID=2719793 RepID=UPI001BD3B40D|nr:hypothetical protein [Bradyrhizobium sp. dw_78]